MPKKLHLSGFKDPQLPDKQQPSSNQASRKVEELKSKSKLNKALFKARGPIGITNTMAEALIASIGEGLIIVDEYGQVSHANQTALDTLRFERDELVGTWWPQTVPCFDRKGAPVPEAERPVLQALLTGLPVSSASSFRRGDNTKVPVYVTASPYLVKGRPRGAIIVFRDISKEVQIEQAKDEFVSIASHQLRTPLTAIRLFAELLQNQSYGKLSKKQLDYIDKIQFSAERMIDLVTELLNISRLNLGQLRLNPRPTSLVTLVAKRLEEIKPLADSRGADLVFENHLSSEEKVLIDRDLVGQAVHNLLSNAVRYSPENKGCVTLTLSKTPKNYRLTVADNGIGIPASAKGQIYQRFYRASNATRTVSEGTGLGLYLVKAVVDAYGGKIWHKSPPGGGTIFYITLPRQRLLPAKN